MSDTDMRRRLSDLVDTRPLDVEERLRSLHEGRRPSRSKRAITIAVALAVALVGVVIVVRAFVRSEGTVPGAASKPRGQIAFMLTNEDPAFSSDAYVVNADGTGFAQLLGGPHAQIQPVWSPDGTRVALVQSPPEERSYDLYVMNADGSGLEEIPIDGLSVASGVSWSPDGTRLAFTSNAPDGTGLNVYVINADGSGLKRVLGGVWVGVAWSPDGRMFALAGYPDDSTKPDHQDIYTVAVDGSGLTRVSHAGTEVWLRSPAWSPDGTHIAFTQDDAVTGRSDIYIMNVDGTGRTQLTDWKGSEGAPLWSPDGEWIAFASDRGATNAQLERNREGGYAEVGFDIWIMRADGTDARQITASDGNPFPSSWRAQTG